MVYTVSRDRSALCWEASWLCWCPGHCCAALATLASVVVVVVLVGAAAFPDVTLILVTSLLHRSAALCPAQLLRAHPPPHNLVVTGYTSNLPKKINWIKQNNAWHLFSIPGLTGLVAYIKSFLSFYHTVIFCLILRLKWSYQYNSRTFPILYYYNFYKISHSEIHR